MLIEVIKCCVPVHLFLFGLLFFYFMRNLLVYGIGSRAFFAFLEQELFDLIAEDWMFHKSQP